MKTVRLDNLPIGSYFPVLYWMIDSDIGDVKKQVQWTHGEVKEVNVSDEEWTMIALRWN